MSYSYKTRRRSGGIVVFCFLFVGIIVIIGGMVYLSQTPKSKSKQKDHIPISKETESAAKKYKNVSQKARDALAAVKKISYRVEAGLNYQQYLEVVGQQYAEAKPFIESEEGKTLEEFSYCLYVALIYYKSAGDSWQLKIKHPSLDNYDLDKSMQDKWGEAQLLLNYASELLDAEKVRRGLQNIEKNVKKNKKQIEGIAKNPFAD